MTANTNDFVPWAVATGANVLAPSDYRAAVIRQQGAQIGIADPLSFNSAMRQATSIAAMIAQFTADYGPTGNNVQDNGDLVTLEAEFVAALTALIETLVTPVSGSSYFHFGGADSGGAANTYVLAAPSPALASYVTGTTIVFKPAHANDSGSTLNANGLGAKTIVRIDGSALQAGDLNTSGIALVVYDGTNFVLIDILQTIAGVPTATTTSNGVSREATNAEMIAGATSGSVPAFVTPEGLPLYAEGKWTSVVRSGGHTETAYNEHIEITASTTAIITLMTPVGVAHAYEINNTTGVNQTISTPAGAFTYSFFPGATTASLTVPPNCQIKLRADGTNWVCQWFYMAATPSLLGYARLANDTEGTNGVTNTGVGPSPAVMTPERVALFFAAHVANTTTRGIARQATTSEMMNGATSGSSPAFVTPEGLQYGNPFTMTGIGAAIILTPNDPSNMAAPPLGTTFSFLAAGPLFAWGYGSDTFYGQDLRWSPAPGGTWQVAQIAFQTAPGGVTVNVSSLVALRIA